ncbi:hypothetical protein SAMN05443247_10112 [Bradyrhizobium erythrophlei]|jgi:hypothetical protein|nr:hypothetical protein SAMN05443247_10112 [Bradyrhizobium erythrophlei]
MAYRVGIAQGYAVRDGAVACNEAVRNAGPTMIAGGHVATGEGVRGVGLEATYAVTASAARRSVQGMNAPATKTTSGMKAATMKTASGTKATATVETATTTTVETATTTAAMKTAATAAARLGYVREGEPQDCARQDPSER